MSKRTGILEEDIKWTMEKVKILKISNGQPYICTDEKFLAELFKMAGTPSRKVILENIHYVPYKLKWENPSAFL